MFIVKRGITKQGLLKVFAADEIMGFQDIRNAAIEALDHAICLRPPGTGQAMLDIQRGAKLVELMLAAGLPVVAQEPIRECLAIVREQLADANRACLGEIAQERPCAPGGLVRLDFQIDPAGCPIRWPRTDSAVSSHLPSVAGTSRPDAKSPARNP